MMGQGGKRMKKSDEQPSTVTQLTAAMAALGQYTGENSAEEHSAEAKRLGGMKVYQMFLANALMGLVEGDVLLADSTGVTAEQMQAAHRQALIAAGVADDLGKLLHFLRWRALRVESPLREIAQHTDVGPLPLAAAHVAEALQQILGVCAAGQNLETASPSAMTANLKAAREALTNGLANLDSMLELLAQAEDFFSS